jgi:heptosyltransferase-2
MCLACSATAGETLAVRLPNWLGDACMALPALGRLRAAGFSLACFGKGWAKDLLAAEPDRVEKLPGAWRADAALIRACGARRGVLFPNSFGSALRMRLAGVAAAGHGGLRSALLGRSIHRVPGSHEVEAFWQVAGAWCPEGRPPGELGLRLADRHRAEAAAALDRAGVAGRYSVVAPLAVGRIRGQSKQWPGFRLLARLLAERGPVVACPGPGEEAAMRAALPDAILCDGLGVGAYAAVMSGAHVVVANDSGPMHLAAACGAAVVGVFGVSDPGRTRPWSPRARTVGDAAGWPTVDQVAAVALEAA